MVYIRWLCMLWSIAFIFLPCSLYAESGKVLTWDECVIMAEEKNPDLVSAREKIMQRESDVGITRSTVLPQISASASADKSSVRSNNNLTRGTSGTENSYSYSLNGKQLLFDGMKSYYDYRGAESRVAGAQYDYRISSVTVRYNLRVAFVGLLEAQQMISITKEIETRRKHNLDLVKMRYSAGSDHIGSYYAAKADYTQALSDSASARRSVDNARRKLGMLIGRDDYMSTAVSGDILPQSKYDEKPALESIAAKHPSMVRAELAKQSALYDTKSAKLDFSPKLYGNASVGKNVVGSGSPTTNWSFGVELSAPLFEGGQTYYSMTKADSVYRQTESDEKSVKDSLVVSLEQSWNALIDGIENVEVQKEYLDAAKERSKIGEMQYSIGLLSFDNWTILETNLVNAMKTYLQACTSVLSAEAAWIQSSGGMLEYEAQK